MPDNYLGDDLPTFRDRLSHAWNAFRNKDPSYPDYGRIGGVGYSIRPDRPRLMFSTNQTIIAAIYNRIATDVACAELRHVRVDDNDNFVTEINSGLNNILTLEANLDQSSTCFVHDMVMSMLDEGVIAVVPIDTDLDPMLGSFDVKTVRTARIVQWFPETVRLDVYNDRTGHHQQITMPKSKVAILENPFYSVMNEPNSVLKRLSQKMAMLDVVDEQSSSGKLDLIIQLPYVIKSEKRQQQAELRRKQIEEQLSGTKYGIAYTDGTERITQLNRSVENNLMAQIEYLTSMLYSQLGITQEIMNGTASEEVMINYYKRTIDVILRVIVDEFRRKFLTKTARSQKQTVQYYRDPFSLTPTTAIADIADKFTRNEILNPNEVRGIVGFKPSKDPKSNELRNRNINQSAEEAAGSGHENGGGEENDLEEEP